MKYDITNKTISSFTMYKFLEDITKPFTQLDAFRKGLIDEEGYFKLPSDVIAPEIPSFDLFVIYVKRLLDQIPNPATKAKLNSFTAAMTLFKECLDEYSLDGELVVEGIVDGMVELNLIEQEAAAAVHANNVGSGEIAGMGNKVEEDGFDNIATYTKKRCNREKDNPLCNVINFISSLQRRKSP